MVACEFSGVVREAFSKRGHEAWSCDLLPSLQPGNHIQGNVLDYLDEGWDLMLAFPPCTHLAVSGARYFREKQEVQHLALDFVQALLLAPIKKICLENPVGIISTRIRKPDQIIQPYQFGHSEAKRTCLWLKGLPLLKSTEVLPLPKCGYWDNQTPSKQNKLSQSPKRAMLRSITYQGIADAMAEQWST